MKQKKRLDMFLQERYPTLSRNVIQGLIMQGKVMLKGEVVTKAGHLVDDQADIDVDLEEPRYVSRAGFKLEEALDYFGIDVQQKVALDAGLSTGGFTDCLLQRGIARVYGVDVGYGQVHEKIRTDQHVIVMERVNLRHLTSLPETVDLVTLDLSFISVLKVIEVVAAHLRPQGVLIVLIKPQFEAAKHEVGKGGIVKDAKVLEKVVAKVMQGIEAYGFSPQGVIPSSTRGTMGNQEFLACFIYTGAKAN